MSDMAPAEIRRMLQDLIALGQQVARTRHGVRGTTQDAVDRDQFTNWRERSVAVLRRLPRDGEAVAKRFTEATQQPWGFMFQAGQSILEGELAALPMDAPTAASVSALSTVETILSGFHRAARAMRGRHEKRATLDVKDEYDVQDLLRSLLALHFEDVREEECTPSYAGAAARMDFLLKPQKTVIEVKRTRPGLGDKEIGSQLIEDIARYAGHPDCQTLICFVYDPEGLISNPAGLGSDLERQSTATLRVRVLIFPR